jgi:probable HAF family extracellular repeat protein
MAYESRTEGGYGATASVIHSDSSQHSIVVPDAELLFTGDYRRAGPDLVITGHDGRHHLIPGYFSSEHPPALIAPSGAGLSPDVVALLAGSPTPGQYAQAQPTLPPDAIGKIEKVVGDVTVVRNGVAVALHVGDAVYKSDVVQTGAGSSVGISFPDGTALNMVANTRMALNEYTFDPASNSNSALFTLVEGTFAFVAGQVAHTGDMKIGTPVATMGIRGTTGVVEEEVATVSATQGGVTYSFAVVADFGTGVAGQFDLIDQSGNVIATVSQTGLVTYVTPQGPGQQALLSVQPMTNTQFTVEQDILQQLLQTVTPFIQQQQQQQQNTTPGSSQPPPATAPNPIQQLLQNGNQTYTFANNSGNGTTTTTTTTATVVVTPPPSTPTATPIVFWTGANTGDWNAASNWSDVVVPTSFSAIEILMAATVFVTDAETANGLDLGPGATLEIGSGGFLAVSNLIAGPGTLELNAGGADPTLAINGAVSLATGVPGSNGTILLTGAPSGDNAIVGVASTTNPAVLTNVDFIITGAGTIGTGDGNLTLINEAGGAINATGLLIVETGNQVVNSGLMEATAGGTLQINDSVSNAGTLQATGADAVVTMSGATLDNTGGVLATANGAITFTDVAITNESGATFEASLGGIVTVDGGTFANSGSVGTLSGGTLTVESLIVTNSGAGAVSIAADSTFNIDNAAIVSGGVDNAGTINVNGSSAIESLTVTNTGAGQIQVATNSELSLDGATVTGGTIDLLAGTGSSSITEISIPGISSVAPAISANGDYTAFISASALPGHDSGLVNTAVELYDSATDQLTNISALVPSGDLHPGEQFDNLPAISANGQYVAFEGQYQQAYFMPGNPPDTGPNTSTQSDVFLYNTQSQTITMVGLPPSTGGDGNVAIDGNGQLLVTDFTNVNNYYQDYALVTNASGIVQDTITGDPGYQPNGGNTTGDPGSVEDPSISANGEFVTFWSTASVIAVTNANGVPTLFLTGNTAQDVAQVYVYDRETNTLQTVSVNNHGHQGNADSGTLSLGNDNNNSWASGVSGNGTYVVFQSAATNLVPGSGSGANNGVQSIPFEGSASNVYLYDTQTHTITLVSAGLNSVAANGASYYPEISADGNYVTFESTASNLVAGGSDGQAQSYIYNIQTGTVQLASAAANGTPADNESDGLATVSNGSSGPIVEFGSLADNLVVPDANDGNLNIFAVNLNEGDTAPPPAGALDVTANSTLEGTTVSGGTLNVASGVMLTIAGDGVTSFEGVTTDNLGVIQIDGGATLSVDANSVLVNAGQLDVNADGTFVVAGDVNNVGGTITAAGVGATVQLAGATVVEGTMSIGATDTLTILDTGNAIEDVILNNSGNVTVGDGLDAATLSMADGTAMTGGTLTINALATVEIDSGVLYTGATWQNLTVNNEGTLVIASAATLSLAATINGGTITDNGIIDIVGTSVIDSHAALTGGEVTIESGQTLTVNDATVTGSTIEDVVSYTFTNVQDPSAVNSDYQFGGQTFEINNAGVIIGNYADANNNSYGFGYSGGSNGTYQTVSDPDADLNGSFGGTTVTGINSAGTAVGYASGSEGIESFVDQFGTYTNNIVDPDAPQSTYALGINDSGEVVGVAYINTNDTEGFIYNNGSSTSINDPNASDSVSESGNSSGTFAFAINASGQVLGDYFDNSGNSHGFIYNTDGSFTDITVAGATATYAEGINNAGQAVGYYVDASNEVHGFLYSGGSVTTLNDPAAAGGTAALAINNTGEVVGYYWDGNGNEDVFTYSNGIYTNIAVPDADDSIEGVSVNDAGQIVVTYYGDNGELDGLLLNPSTAASTLVLSGGATVSDSSLAIGVGDSLQIEDGPSVTLSGDTVTGGSIVIASGAVLDLSSIIDGSSISNQGEISVDGPSTFSDVTFTTLPSGGQSGISIDGGQSLTWQGTDTIAVGHAISIANEGTMAVDGALVVGLPNLDTGDVQQLTLTGSGSLVLDGGSIHGSSDALNLINDGNAISGFGQLGEGAMILDNDSGSIAAQTSGETLTLDTASILNATTISADDGGELLIERTQTGSVAVTNPGTIEATAGSNVVLEDAIVTNTNGVIAANGAGSTIDLSATTISGGTIDLAGPVTTQSISEISVPGLDSFGPSISGNGQYIAFATAAELIQDQGHSIELYDVGSAQLTNISALVPSGDLHPGETFSDIPDISANGQYVVFKGDYQVTSGDETYTQSDVFLYNVQNQQITDLGQGGAPAISADGSAIVMEDSPAIEVKNDSGSVVTTITGDPNYTQPDGGPPFGNAGSVYDPAISGNGQYVSFWTTAYEVVINGTPHLTDNPTASSGVAGIPEVYVYDTATDTLQMVSVNNQGQPGTNASGGIALPGDQDSNPSPLSANGTYVVFQSSATNLVAGSGSGAETNGVTSQIFSGSSNIYLYDTQTHSITLVSAGLNGAAANGASYFPTVSADGNSVIFESTATNLVAGDTTDAAQTYLYDVQTGVITLASAATDGTPGDGESDLASSLSNDGSSVAYGGFADNLVDPTANTGESNIYLANLATAPAGTVNVTGAVTINDGATIIGGTVNVASDSTLTLNDVTVNGSTLTAGATDGGVTDAIVSLTGGVLNYATLDADSGGTINITINNTTDYIWNTGSTIEAFSGGTVNITGNDDIDLTNNGTIEADGGTITIMHDDTSVVSHSTVKATDGGTITLTSTDSPLGGASYSTDDADDGTIIFNGGITLDGGALAEAIHRGTLDIYGGVNNASGATMEALSGGKFDIKVTVAGVDTTGITNSGTMKADHATFGIKIDDSNDNAAGGMSNSGTIKADHGTLGITFCTTGNDDSGGIGNTGTIESDRGGTLNINFDISGDGNSFGLSNSNQIIADGGVLNINSDITGDDDGFGFQNSGTVAASYGGHICITADVNNETGGQIGAASCGTVTINGAYVTNAADASIGALGGGTVAVDSSHVVNYGQIGPNGGTVTFDHSYLDNFAGGTGDPIQGIVTDSSGVITISCSTVVNEDNAQIVAQDGGSITFCDSSISNSGGTSHDSNGLDAYNGGSITFDNSCVDNTGFIRAFTGGDGSAGTVYIDDSTVYNDCGFISAIGAGDVVQLSNATICGGMLETSGGGLIQAVSGSSTLDNSCIDNSGQIGALTGSGDGGSAGTMLIENSTVNNACGTIFAIGSGDTVQLSDATINGGTLGGSDGGMIQVVSAPHADMSILDGASEPVTINGYVGVASDANLALEGTINLDSPNGEIDVGGGSLVVEGSVAVNANVTDGDPEISLASGAATLAAAAPLNTSALDTADTTGLTFVPVDVGAFGTYTAAPPGAPAGTEVVNIPPGDGQSGYFEITFTLPEGFTDASIAGAANADDVGRVFLNGVALTSSIVSGGSDEVTEFGNATFSSADQSDFQVGVNTLLVSDANTGGGPSGAAFYADVTYTSASPSTISLDGGQIISGCDGGTLDNASNTIQGAGDVGTGNSLTLINDVGGIIDANVSGGMLALDTGCNTITNDGVLEATNGGILDVQSAVCGPGSVTIGGGGTADFEQSLTENVAFTGAGTLALADTCAFSSDISGFGTGDMLDLTDVRFACGPTVTWTQGDGSGTLSVTAGGVTDNFTLEGTYNQNEFGLAADNGNGTDVTFTQNWQGETVKTELFYPNLGTVYQNFGDSTVPVTNLTDVINAGQGLYATLSVGANTIEASDFTGSGSFFSASFNGFKVTDLSGHAVIASVAIDSATNMAGLTLSDISYSGNSVSLDWAGLSFTTDTIVELDLTFGTAPIGTSTADNYVWAGSASGSWDIASNWDDTTAGHNPASVAPGINDNVTINAAGGDATQVITGVGDAASLTINGPTELAGDFTVGTLAVNSTVEIGVDDTLTVTGNVSLGLTDTVTVDGTMTVGSFTQLAFGTLSGTGTFTVTGATSIAAPFVAESGAGETVFEGTTSINSGIDLSGGRELQNDGTLTWSGGANINFGTGGGTLDNATGATFQIVVGETIFSFGSGTSVFTNEGTITQSVTTESTSIDVAFDNTGTVNVDSGTLLLDGALSGNGQINIGSGASLTIEGSASASTGTIAFEGTSDTLTIYSSALNGSHDLAPTLSGLNASDAIDYEGAVTSASYDSGNGDLTLLDGDTTVAILDIGAGYGGDTWTITSIDGGTVSQIVDPPGTTPAVASGIDPAAATVASGSSLTVASASSQTVDFAGGTGTLVLDQPENFTGQISGFTGTAPDAAHSDVIDLAGINFNSAAFSESYNTSTGVLTVTDGTDSASLTFDNFNATLEFASDGNGGTDIFDPPAAPAGQATGHGMNFGHDQISLAANILEAGASQPSVSIGGTGHDNFQFHSNGGIEGAANAPSSPLEVAHPGNAPANQQLAALLSHETPFDPLFDAAHDTGGALASQFHQVVASASHLH